MDRRVRLYLIGLTASTVGTSAMALVAGIWVKALTGSSRQLGAALIGVLDYRAVYALAAALGVALCVWVSVSAPTRHP